jgi:hypothetical protein
MILFMYGLVICCSTCICSYCLVRGYHGRHRVVVGFTTTYMQSVYITTDASSNLEQGEVYNIMG